MVDAATIQAARAGDAAARTAIADAFDDRVRRYVTAMVGDHEADDLAQETFRLAFDRLDQLQNPDRLSSWIYSIAINLVRAHLKRQINAGDEPLTTEPMDRRSSVLSSVVKRESAAALALAVDRLPILLREAFVLHVVEGLPYAEIATITAASVNALQVRAHRARALLRRQLGAVVDTFWSQLDDGAGDR